MGGRDAARPVALLAAAATLLWFPELTTSQSGRPTGGNIALETNAAVAVTHVLATGDTGLPGYSTFALELQLTGNALNVYTIYGTNANPMIFPPAFQTPTGAFGTNMAGLNPQIISTPMCGTPTLGAVDANHMGCDFDSWLTVGITEGDDSGAMGNIGIPFDQW